jgi:hypothetical protein
MTEGIATMKDASATPFPERISSSEPRPPHALLWTQVLLAIVFVFIGISERNPMFAWAQWLAPIVVVGGPALMASPFVIGAICIRRRVSLTRTIAALMLSISLTTVAIWGLLPLVQ